MGFLGVGQIYIPVWFDLNDVEISGFSKPLPTFTFQYGSI